MEDTNTTEDCAQYAILEEALWRGHKYMIVEDTHTHTIRWATEFTNPDILKEAPDFSKFYGYVTGDKDEAVDFAAEEAMRTIDNYLLNNSKETDKMEDEEMQSGCATCDEEEVPYDEEDPYEVLDRSIYDDKDDSNIGKKGERHAQEEPQAVKMRRTLAWAINNLRMKVDPLKALCEKKAWDAEICYDIEECIAKLGECLAQLTIWDEEKYD